MVGLRQVVLAHDGGLKRRWRLVAHQLLQIRLMKRLLDDFNPPSPRLDRHPLARIGRRRSRALDRGAAAGGDRTARAAFASWHRRHDCAGLSRAGARAALQHRCPSPSCRFSRIGISTEHIDYPGTLTLPPETALKSWMALGESVARAGLKKLVMVTSHGGNSAAMSLVAQDLRAQHRILVVTTGWCRLSAAGDTIFRRRSRARHPWRRRRDLDHAGAIWRAGAARGDRRFSSLDDRDGEGFSLALHAAAGAVRLADPGPSSERRRGRCDAGLRRERRAPDRSGRAGVLRIARRCRPIRPQLLSNPPKT